MLNTQVINIVSSQWRVRLAHYAVGAECNRVRTTFVAVRAASYDKQACYARERALVKRLR
eukprot:scaffold372027_cov15-Prasinocladus_malaysianus.AAC.1